MSKMTAAHTTFFLCAHQYRLTQQWVFQCWCTPTPINSVGERRMGCTTSLLLFRIAVRSRIYIRFMHSFQYSPLRIFASAHYNFLIPLPPALVKLRQYCVYTSQLRYSPIGYTRCCNLLWLNKTLGFILK